MKSTIPFLLQTKNKILAKILSKRLNAVILVFIVHSDQTGIMPGNSTALNVCRMFTNPQSIHGEMGARVIGFLGAAKSFD